MVQPSGLVKDLQGINAVVPLPPTGTGPCTGLTQQQLADVTAAFVRSLGIGEGAAPAAAAAGGAALPLFASISLAHVLGRSEWREAECL